MMTETTTAVPPVSENPAELRRRLLAGEQLSSAEMKCLWRAVSGKPFPKTTLAAARGRLVEMLGGELPREVQAQRAGAAGDGGRAIQHRSRCAGTFGRLGRQHADHLRAHVREEHGRKRRGRGVAEVQHPQAIERQAALAHCSASLVWSIGNAGRGLPRTSSATSVPAAAWTAVT